ncbi:uncharacterized protein CDAR_269311 [Caerostris darwini]|uniref:Gustatory receptor n=1 Tax=Caerostris darwini TaxID=1538125 RepID=A0AAV4NX95_9ARAC|nr:uncharacterized protein CDAR_269311 [Caerostris darwini]
MTSFLLWCFVRTRRGKILDLIEKLESLQEKLDYDSYKKALKISKIATVCAFLVICLQPFVLALRYFLNQGEGLTCVLLEMSSDEKFKSVVTILLHEFASIYVNTSITYSVALFYTLYCYVFALCLKEEERSVSQTFCVYQKVLQIFKNIEKVLSVLIFIVLAHFLVSLFKDMIVLVNVAKSGQKEMLLSYSVDFITCGALTTIVVFSAEIIQCRANSIREFLSNFIGKPYGLNISCIKLFEDQERLKLTGWGTFTLRKPLLLTLVAWLISYGVIIFQFMST